MEHTWVGNDQTPWGSGSHGWEMIRHLGGSGLHGWKMMTPWGKWFAWVGNDQTPYGKWLA